MKRETIKEIIYTFGPTLIMEACAFYREHLHNKRRQEESEKYEEEEEDE